MHINHAYAVAILQLMVLVSSGVSYLPNHKLMQPSIKKPEKQRNSTF